MFFWSVFLKINKKVNCQKRPKWRFLTSKIIPDLWLHALFWLINKKNHSTLMWIKLSWLSYHSLVAVYSWFQTIFHSIFFIVSRYDFSKCCLSIVLVRDHLLRWQLLGWLASCTLYSRVEWFSTFCDFRKPARCSWSGIIFGVQFQKTSKLGRARVARTEKFSFLKIHRKKLICFWQLANTFLLCTSENKNKKKIYN